MRTRALRAAGPTGPMSDIGTVGDSVDLAIKLGQKLPRGGCEVVHGTSVFDVDRSNEVPVVWTEGTSTAQNAADIHSRLGRAS